MFWNPASFFFSVFDQSPDETSEEECRRQVQNVADAMDEGSYNEEDGKELIQDAVDSANSNGFSLFGPWF